MTTSLVALIHVQLLNQINSTLLVYGHSLHIVGSCTWFPGQSSVHIMKQLVIYHENELKIGSI